MLLALWPHLHEILVALRDPIAGICTTLSDMTPWGSVIVVDTLIVFDSRADFDWPTRVTRVTLTWYPVYAAHAVPWQ